ncbi:MAG TPA: AAA family ATPase, partial [Chitinophagales bacterium]|nr:AAA family ATPase [Chitinophagales bacterium]
MIETLSIKNFRQIKDQTIELSPVVVVIGPNNGGKTSFLQAICLFATALQTWSAVVQQRTTNKTNRKTSVAIQLENLVNIPIAAYRELWTDLQLRSRTTTAEGKTATQAIKIEIHATGYTQQQYWRIGFEFDYGRDSLIYVRLAHNEQGEQYDFPPILTNEHIGYLPAMSGLNPWEDKLEKGSILRHIGNGKTADVLRNLCYLLYTHEDAKVWQQFTQQIEQLFQIQLQNPQYFPSSGLLKMTYHEGNKKDVDLSALGSGAKQTMLLFAYMWGFPNTVTLLDEPDAHLEVIRQKNIYDQISDIAKQNHTQLIIASHSESVLSTAFGKDTVISSVFGQLAKVNHKTHI